VKDAIMIGLQEVKIFQKCVQNAKVHIGMLKEKINKNFDNLSLKNKKMILICKNFRNNLMVCASILIHFPIPFYVLLYFHSYQI
jgi:hypothetical protein